MINDFIKHAEIEDSLAKHNPELAAEWHPTKNGSLTPKMVLAGSDKKVWWQCKYGHEWEARVADRTKGNGCPYCAGQKVWVGFNDLATTHPMLAAEWHPTKNGKLTPQKVSKSSNKKVWWQCEHGHAWEAAIYSRINGNGCPYCSGRLPIPGITDLTTTHPAIATQWHPTKNGDITPTKISRGYSKPVYWKCTQCGHEYQRSPYEQTRKNRNPRCPHCKTPVNSSSDSDKIPS